MTPNERCAVERLQDDIRREQARTECPCVRALPVILSDGLERIAEADEHARRAA